MPEIKNQFTGGKMNKDLDERLVPDGEYRDAMNIQVSTSEGSDVGAVQNILGNTPGCVYNPTSSNPSPSPLLFILTSISYKFFGLYLIILAFSCGLTSMTSLQIDNLQPQFLDQGCGFFPVYKRPSSSLKGLKLFR